jgi:hypothetical protein
MIITFVIFAIAPQRIMAVLYSLASMSDIGNAPNVEQDLKTYIGLNITAEK